MTKSPQKRQNEKRRALPRISPMFLSGEAIDSLNKLMVIHGSRRAAIEYLLLNASCNT